MGQSLREGCGRCRPTFGKIRGPDLDAAVFLQGSAGKPRAFNRKQVECGDAADWTLGGTGILRRYQFRCAPLRRASR
jgi:hypothetical protein